MNQSSWHQFKQTFTYICGVAVVVCSILFLPKIINIVLQTLHYLWQILVLLGLIIGLAREYQTQIRS